MLPSSPTSVREEGQPGWAISVPWTLRAAWHQPHIPQQAREPDAALYWHLLPQPAKSRTRLLQCPPRGFPQLSIPISGTGFSDCPSATGRLRELVRWLRDALEDRRVPRGCGGGQGGKIGLHPAVRAALLVLGCP